MTSPARIAIALGHFDDLLALGLAAALAVDPSLSVVARDVTVERLPATLRAHRPQVLIFDVAALPRPADVRALRLEHPATRLVALGDTMSVLESAQLLAFGASACLATSTQSRDVRNAVHLASRGLQLLPVGAPAPDGARQETSLLTRREGDVLLLLRQGASNAEIALALQIGVETVRTHARAIYRKLGVSSRRSLAHATHE